MKPLDRLTDEELAARVPQAAALPDAPPALIEAAIDAWPTAYEDTAPQIAPLRAAAQAVARRLAAVLSFDSWAGTPLAYGMRALPSETRHLLFSAMGRDIDLRITPEAEHFALAGQILGPDESGRVELVGADAAGARVATIDAQGEFRLDAVRRGTYLLTLRMGGDEIVLPPIEVGERRRQGS